jgi:MFS family permease
VLVNAFVGAMVGLERSILPAIAEQEFSLTAKTALLSLIVVFGVAKAITNYGAGRLADRFGRKRVLVGGWLVAVPVPFLLMWAPTWNWVLIANLFLGISLNEEGQHPEGDPTEREAGANRCAIS